MIKARFGFSVFFYLFVGHTLIGQTISYDPDKMYSPDILKADLRYIREKLGKMHPALYRYTSKPMLDVFLIALSMSLHAP